MAKAKAPTGDKYKKIVTDGIKDIVDDPDLLPATKKAILAELRHLADTEGVKLAGEGKKEGDVWKGVFLKVEDEPKKPKEE